MSGQLAVIALLTVATSSHAAAEPPCSLRAYDPVPGLSASATADGLEVTWEGDRGSELRMRLAIERGTPTIRTLDVRPRGGRWRTLVTDVTPEFRVASGLRRVTAQQLRPDSLEALGVGVTEAIRDAWDRQDERGDAWVQEAVREGGLTAEMVEAVKWEAFWDAPLFIEGSGELPPSHQTSIPPQDGLFDQPGLPRQADEVTRATATFAARHCEVSRNGSRLEITFDGVELGIFSGRLQFDVFKGSNLIRQAVIATTDHSSAAFKFDGGLEGLPLTSGSRVVWRDLANRWQEYRFGGPDSEGPATVWSSNRLIAAEVAGGAIAAFPPPHSFYWARESEQNLGYSWYRKDSDGAFSFGVRQAEQEEDDEFYHNFALYSARPGTWQQMPVFLYVSPESGEDAVDGALAFTRGDRFKPLPGYKVMGSHYHVGLVRRLRESGGMDNRLNDIEAAKAAGIDIYGVIDGGRGRGEAFLESQAAYYDAARRHSDEHFLIMPNDENFGVNMGGHADLLLSKPVFWRPEREPGQPLVDAHPVYGRVYNLGSPADVMAMTERENALVFAPHPRSKGSTGYPDAISDTAHFRHENYRGIGWRWGMGIDASERQLCEYRCQGVLDDMNNWIADLRTPAKHVLGISEARSDLGHRGRPPYDDTYGMSPVSYVKLDRVPPVDDMGPIIDALRRGDYFVTSGEVLIASYAVERSGDRLTITADVEWTFPLDYVEVVWGDGTRVDREVVSAAHLPPFGTYRFEIPLDAAGKKWVRFAAWDVATNGALAQPVMLDEPPSRTETR